MKAKKQFGQNFLHNSSTLEFIANSLYAKPGDTVVEIGGGTGNLTKYLTAIPEIHLFVIELDKDCIPILQAIHSHIIHANVLDVDFTFAARQKVVGNIPYYITKPIITHLYQYRTAIISAVLMVQYEVARLLCAHPGESEYSGYSAYVQSFSRVEFLRKVNKDEFSPQPSIDSAIVQLTFLPDDPEIGDQNKFSDFIFSCFRQPRKTLMNNLKIHYSSEKICSVLHEMELRSDIRAEALSSDVLKVLFLNLRARR